MIFGLGYLAACELAYVLTPRAGPAEWVAFRPACGVLVAALSLSSRRSWPRHLVVAGLAGVASDVLHDVPIAASFGFVVARGAEAAVSASLLGLVFPRPVTLSRVSEVVGFSALAVLVGPVAGATVGVGVEALHGKAFSGELWRAWWAADATGILVIAPALMTIGRVEGDTLRGAGPRRVAELTILILGLVLIDIGIYRDILPPPWNVPTFLLPFLLWATVRFNPPVASTCVALVAFIGSHSVAGGYGPFANKTAEAADHIRRAQGTLVVIAPSVLLLAAIVAERKRAERQKAGLIAELERALREVKALRDLIPLCSWCRKIRDDQGYWQSLEVYLREQYDAKISHGICPSCADSHFGGVATSSAPASEGPAPHDRPIAHRP